MWRVEKNIVHFQYLDLCR